MAPAYYQLTKPGIVFGNVVTVVAGYFLGSAGGRFDASALAAVAAGSALIIAAAGALNNYTDQSIDARMTRTRHRPLPAGLVTPGRALWLAGSLAAVGFLVLAIWTNWLTLLIGLTALVDYVVAYAFFKRRTVYGTAVGSISGALPMVAGYCAATGRLDITAAVLFGLMVLWQMPHFYAIAVYRLKDYQAAGLPVLPVARGVAFTRRRVILYLAAFMAAAPILFVIGHAGYTYLAVMLLLSAVWLRMGLSSFAAVGDATAWGRRLFRFSLIVVMAMSVLVAFGPRLT